MKFFLSLLIILIAHTSFCQPTEEKIVAALDSFSIYHPQEKTYVMTDKNAYVAGESVYCKAFTTLFEKPGILSKVIYITLSDQSGKIIVKKMLPLTNGSADASFDIDPALTAGSYNISAYTLWMLNYPEFIFSKKITIFNTDKNIAQKNAGASTNSISFFPEGGNLLAGVNNVVAFKAINNNNEPVTVSGNIVDEKNNTVATISTQHDGMGTFTFTPKAGSVYKFAGAPGFPSNVFIGKLMEEGISLSADNSNAGKTFVKVQRAEKNKAAYNELLIVAQQHYKIVYMAKLNIDEGLDAVAINKKNLPPGIMQITVLTKDGVPLCERLVFVANHTINTSLLAPVWNTEKRTKNTLSVDVSAFRGLDMAVAVSNAEADPKSAEHSILSALLLTADLKGNINEPAFYFKNKEQNTLGKLDLVMLTNGWRRFIWKDIMSANYPALKFPFETGLSITGKVMKANGKTALKDGKINMIIKGEDSSSIMSEATLNERSEFVIDKISYKKNATVYYQGTNQQRQAGLVNVNIDPVYFDTVKMAPLPVFNRKAETLPAGNLLSAVLSLKEKDDAAKSKLLTEIVLKSKRLSPEDSATRLYASPIFENSDQTLLIDPSEGSYDVWQYLQRKVPGVMVDKSNGTPVVTFSRYSGLDFFNQEENNNIGVQFFLNEVSVSPDVVDAINPGDIGIVKVFKGASAIALGAGRGAIALYTVKGRSVRDWRDRGFDFFKKSGYSVSREFYNMDYSKLNPLSQFSDNRTTLYWNPSVLTKDGKAVIEFYNDDVTKKFRVVLEGIDKDGKLLHIEQ